MRISVTEEDIKFGRRSDSEGCAIARSLNNRGFRNVRVGGDGDGTYVMASGNRYQLSPAARTFIFKFDRNMPVSPSTFVLSPYTKNLAKVAVR